MILTEAAVRQNMEEPSVPGRSGFEWGIPSGGIGADNAQSKGATRLMLMEQLHDAYMACEPTANCVDVTARAVTAGGLILVPDDDVPEGKQPAEPPNVAALRQLMQFTNPREDLVQVLRGVASDLEIFGDSYIEVTCVIGQPVALYSLDAASMAVLADEHGEITGYKQYIDQSRSVVFEPEQVIHFSQDAPRGGLYGVSPVQKSLISVTSWLHWSTCLSQTGRRGDPPRIHADLPRSMNEQSTQRWYESYMSRNLGVKSIGTPIVTQGGGAVTELSQSKVTDYLEALRQLRDDIFQVHGVPPQKGSVVESGNLGGGTGEAQDKTWRVNKIIPIQSIILEKLNYSLVQKGFGIDGWHLEFEEIDFRDSTIVEEIRVKRFEAGAYTLNAWRAEIGQPPVPGGDDPVVKTRNGLIFVKDIGPYTQAEMNQMNAPLVAAGQVVNAVTGIPGNDGTNPAPVHVIPTGKDSPQQAMPADTGKVPTTQGKPPKEADEEMRKLRESLAKAYQLRRRKALRALPDIPTDGQSEK